MTSPDPDRLAATAHSSGGREADPQVLMTALTTEHFTLQGARASTVSESTARASLFIGALSSALVALGFTSQLDAAGHLFEVFALVVLPTLFLLGVFTVVRLVESSVEDIGYGRAINRVRAYYLEIAGDRGRHFLLGANDDPNGVLANMGIAQPSRWQLYFTLASMILVLNAVVGGCAVAVLAEVLGAPPAPAIVLGALTACLCAAVLFRWQQRVHVRSRDGAEVLYPSPPPGSAPRAARVRGYQSGGGR
jgi:hypothetical protein